MRLSLERRYTEDGGGTNTTVTLRLKLYRLHWHFECTHPSISTVFLLVTRSTEKSPYFFIKISFRTILLSILSPPFRSNKQTYQQVDARVHVFVTTVYQILKRKLESFARATPEDIILRNTYGNTYRFLKLISIVIPELLERRVGTCRFP